jgi:hypothetical protein
MLGGQVTKRQHISAISKFAGFQTSCLCIGDGIECRMTDFVNSRVSGLLLPLRQISVLKPNLAIFQPYGECVFGSLGSPGLSGYAFIG